MRVAACFARHAMDGDAQHGMPRGSLLTLGVGVSALQVPVARTGFPSETLQALRFLLAPDAEVASAGGVQVRATGAL